MAQCQLALGRESQVFVVEETVSGTLEEPAAGDLVLTITTPQHAQERENLTDDQIRDTRSKLSPIAGRFNVGSYSFSTYIKPSGTAGDVPAEAKLLEGLLGTEVISGGTSVTYSPSSDCPKSYSIWMKDSHTVFALSGATIDKGVFKINGKELGMVDWSGGFMKEIHTGTDTIDIALTDTTSLIVSVANYKRFSIGSIFTVDSERMKVTAIDSTSGDLTVIRAYGGTTGATHLINADITPWLPTGTESGTPVHGRLGTVTLDAVNYTVLENEITITNGIVYYEEEMNNQNYASDFGTPEDRVVEGKTTLYFRKGDAARFTDSRDFNSLAFVIPLGNVAGYICTINLPQTKINAPVISGDAERIQELDILPFATTSYDDEISIVFT